MKWDIFKETRKVLKEMGSRRSGHWGHKGVPGKRGGSARSRGGGVPSKAGKLVAGKMITDMSYSDPPNLGKLLESAVGEKVEVSAQEGRKIGILDRVVKGKDLLFVDIEGIDTACEASWYWHDNLWTPSIDTKKVASYSRGATSMIRESLK